ncbi:MAG: ABC transporter permease subunit [Victivallales bacterium]|nr:ABC transporter permease subunit [Victivallales bacterium]
MLISSTTLIGLFPSLSLFVFREQIKLVVDSAMATTLVFGLMAAVLCSSHTISREIRQGTVLLLLSKPVAKWSFVLSKMAGILAALTVFVLICDMATLISLRVAKDQFRLDYLTFYLFYGSITLACLWGAFRNFTAVKSFASSATFALLTLLALLLLALRAIPVEGGKIPPFHFEVVPALLLILFAVWAMGAITVTLSVKLDLVANMLVSSIIFFAGLISDYFFAAAAGTISLKGALYAVIPNWQFFWLADALANNKKIPLDYIAWSSVYIILYIVFCSTIAVSLFSGREVGESGGAA